MRIRHGDWVVVADSRKCLLLENVGDGERMDLRVVRATERKNPPNRDQAADRPGRYQQASAPRSALEETDWHALAKDRAAQDLAARLNRWALSGAFDRFVFAADPATLGAVRADLTHNAKACLTALIEKRLVDLSIDDIERRLARA